MENQPKRKISYEQSLALERGRAVARRNQRARAAQPQPAPLEAHEHRFDDWTSLYPGSALTHGYERRYCSCGAFEARKVRL